MRKRRLGGGVATTAGLVLAVVVGLVPATAHPSHTFTRLGSDSAEGDMGADLLYLDVAQQHDYLIVKIGLNQERLLLPPESERSLIVWNFSVGPWRSYEIKAYLDQDDYLVLNTTEEDSEECAVVAGVVPGSFDRIEGVVTMRVPLITLGIRSPQTIGVDNHSECYEGVPDVRAYFRVRNDRFGTLHSERVDDFLIERTFRVK